MAEQQIQFNDGAAYERMMGVWSRLAGDIFLDWLSPQPNLAWIDVGCGNGAFTELLVDRCTPSQVQGIDPSEGQLAFARKRPAARIAKFDRGDALALPFPNASFDAAIMALVIFFVPEPGKGVAEMVRVVRPGGVVAAYAWDMFGGGFPHQPIQTEMLAMGHTPMRPPSSEASRMDNLRGIWTKAGLDMIESREIVVERTFADFDDYWSTAMLGSSIGPTVAAMAPDVAADLKSRVRARLPADSVGRVRNTARANAVKGRVPNWGPKTLLGQPPSTSSFQH